jgi:DNA invertase Pin-like site-specific DNA recombinase
MRGSVKMNVGYVRLSRDDDKRNYVSIENQKLIIEQFAISRGMIIDRWYEDDGVSGYSFSRPSFSKMLEDLDDGVDTIIAKDLSRIGRHNAKVLLFLDNLKEQGKRLLLVDDDYDTYQDNDDVIGIKTWYNERYVKDTSKKIKRALGARQKEGSLVIGVPFGYMRNTNDSNKIEVVDIEASYVRYIFDLYLQGFGYRKIANILTEKAIPTPSMVIRDRYLKEGKVYRRNVTNEWSDSMVADILKNDFYIGNLRLHKRERATINGNDRRVAKESQIVFEHNHDGIVEEQTYYIVQEVMKKRVKSNYRGQKRDSIDETVGNIFGGCLYCKDCGSRLTPIIRHKNYDNKYYVCNTYNTKGKRYCVNSHLIKETNLINDVINYIKLCRDSLSEMILTYDMNDFIKQHETLEYKKQYLISSINEHKCQLKTIIAQKIKDLSVSPQNADIINETYMSIQESIMANIHGIEKKLKELEEKNLDITSIHEELKTALEVIDNIISKETINRKDVEILIEKISVDKDSMPDIEFKYGLSSLIRHNPVKELNRREDDIILSLMKIIYEEERDYTSAKYLAKEISNIGYMKSKKTILPYICLMVGKGILTPTEDKLRPYKIVISREELSDMIKCYIDTMSVWWNATDGIGIYTEKEWN